MIRRLIIDPDFAIRLELDNEGITLYREFSLGKRWLEEEGDETCPINITIPQRHLSEFVTLVMELMNEANDRA